MGLPTSRGLGSWKASFISRGPKYLKGQSLRSLKRVLTYFEGDGQAGVKRVPLNERDIECSVLVLLLARDLGVWK